MFQLCLILGDWAYFTPDLANEWGDDWDDAPYQDNAGPPYGKNGPCIKVAFESDLSLPYENGGRWSVQQVNRKVVPWLWDRYNPDPVTTIWAGATLSEFKAIIEALGGRVYIDPSLLFDLEEITTALNECRSLSLQGISSFAKEAPIYRVTFAQEGGGDVFKTLHSFLPWDEEECQAHASDLEAEGVGVVEYFICPPVPLSELIEN